MESFSTDRLAEILEVELDVGTRKALEVAYLLSTQVEEGRPLRFAFVQSIRDHLRMRYNPERRLTPRAVGGEDIRRLCLATELGENCWRIEYDETEKDVVVTGLANYPFEELQLPPFDEWDVLIDVEGTASVSIRIGKARAKYAGCRHFKPDAETVLPALIPKGIIEKVTKNGLRTHGLGSYDPIIEWSRGGISLDEQQYLAHREKLEATMREVAEKVVPLVIMLTLRRMRELEHGGCLVLTNLDALPEGLFPDDRCNNLSAYRRGEYGYNWALLGYVLVRTHLLLAERDGVVVLGDFKGQSLEYAKDNLEHVHLAFHDQQVGRYARLWAQLTAIDGIVVMSELLEPLAFGGITSVPPTFTDVADKGARHRAGAYCATRIPGSVAIVVSQDGAVTAYRGPAGAVEEIELRF